jgi:hypothetical protein
MVPMIYNSGKDNTIQIVKESVTSGIGEERDK